MTTSSQTGTPISKRLKFAALCCIIFGFGVELTGVVLKNSSLFNLGLILFLLGLPGYFIGWCISRRS